MAITLEASAPARGDRAVVFACDEGYAPFALMAAEAIARLHPDRDFDICLCSDGAAERAGEPGAPRGAALPGDDGRGVRRAAARRRAHRGRLPAAGAAGRLRRGVRAAALLRRRHRGAVGRLRGADGGRSRRPRARGGARQHPVAQPRAAARAVPAARDQGRALLQRRDAADRRRALERQRPDGGLRRLRAAAPGDDDPARPEPVERHAAGRLGRAQPGVELAVHAVDACCSRRWRTRTSCISSTRRSPGPTSAGSCRRGSGRPAGRSSPRTTRSGRSSGRTSTRCTRTAATCAGC